MTRTPREIACVVTADIRANDAYANIVLPRAIAQHSLSTRDAADVTALTYGCARWQGFVDSVLGLIVDRSLSTVDGEVIDIIRLGTFELLIDGAPSHVVNEWVNIAKRRTRRASGFVNATLRAVSRLSVDEWREELSHAPDEDAVTVALTNHPAWIVRSFERELGAHEIDELVAANNTPAIPTLVALPGLADVPSNSQRGTLSPYAFYADQGNIALHAGLKEGFVRVQDEGSQIAALLLAQVSEIHPNEVWLDLCAGPGGKSALLAALLTPHSGTLIANEPSDHRATLVRQSLRPFSATTRVMSEDGRNAPDFSGAPFARVLVDAPCSGIGALRRRPEARWRKREDDLIDLTVLQRQLLDAAIDATEINGLVAYVTCSPDARETVDVIDATLAGRDDVEVVDTGAVFDTLGTTAVDFRRGTAVQLWPHRHNTDAMFIQLLRRTG